MTLSSAEAIAQQSQSSLPEPSSAANAVCRVRGQHDPPPHREPTESSVGAEVAASWLAQRSQAQRPSTPPEDLAPRSVFLDCHNLAGGRLLDQLPLQDAADREFQHLFPLPFLPEARRLDTLARRSKWWLQHSRDDRLVAHMAARGYLLFFEAMRDPTSLLPELRRRADLEFARSEPTEAAPMRARVDFASSRMLWLLSHAGAPQME